jgi:hypothetical protein
LKPFFCFFGGKWRAAPRYPKPELNTIIEPFAGAAGYATRYPDRKVILIEKDPIIAALWRYLITASAATILSLPLVPMNGSVDSLDVCPEARSLIGFWMNKGTTRPAHIPGLWMRQGLRPNSFWGPTIRQRIASQVNAISHWTIVEGDYQQSPDIEATWFIDPPYQDAGSAYKCSARDIDFQQLQCWCRSRSGQVMVCENEGANWLPFEPFLTIKGTEGKRRTARSREALWTNSQ